jgi:6,7-dimethyl-8-ribityllumazine synthase
MTPMDDLDRRDEERERERAEPPAEEDDLDRALENVLEGWPSPALADPPELDEPDDSDDSDDSAGSVDEESGVAALVATPEKPAETSVVPPVDDAPAPTEKEPQHAPGELSIPPGYAVREGEARGGRRAGGIVVSRFNGEVTGPLLDSALAELEAHGVERGSITVMPVPGAFELPIAAMALAKTRRFACIVALGCVIRGETPHFEYVAAEAASGLQLAAIETGVPVAFGVLTLERRDQAEPRFAKGADAVRTALEMADLFSNLRAAAAR